MAGEAGSLGQAPAFRVADEQNADFVWAVAYGIVDEDGTIVRGGRVVGSQTPGSDLASTGELGLAGVLYNAAFGDTSAPAAARRRGGAGRGRPRRARGCGLCGRPVGGAVMTDAAARPELVERELLAADAAPRSDFLRFLGQNIAPWRRRLAVPLPGCSASRSNLWTRPLNSQAGHWLRTGRNYTPRRCFREFPRADEDLHPRSGVERRGTGRSRVGRLAPSLPVSRCRQCGEAEAQRACLACRVQAE